MKNLNLVALCGLLFFAFTSFGCATTESLLAEPGHGCAMYEVEESKTISDEEIYFVDGSDITAGRVR